MARPPKPIDWNIVDELLLAGCLGTEIAAHFDITAETFYDRVALEYGMNFSSYSLEKRQKGNSIIRAKQFEKAVVDKDNTMLIWLGKHRLNQVEKKEVIFSNSPELESLDGQSKDLTNGS